MELEFYKKPFETDWCGLYIHDANYQMVAMFVMDIPQETKQRIIDALNSEERIPNKARLTIDPENSGMILNKGENFILIRGWGNLTGTGGHNLSAEEAIKIQDNFRDWILWKLELNKE